MTVAAPQAAQPSPRPAASSCPPVRPARGGRRHHCKTPSRRLWPLHLRPCGVRRSPRGCSVYGCRPRPAQQKTLAAAATLQTPPPSRPRGAPPPPTLPRPTRRPFGHRVGGWERRQPFRPPRAAPRPRNHPPFCRRVRGRPAGGRPNRRRRRCRRRPRRPRARRGREAPGGGGSTGTASVWRRGGPAVTAEPPRPQTDDRRRRARRSGRRRRVGRANRRAPRARCEGGGGGRPGRGRGGPPSTRARRQRRLVWAGCRTHVRVQCPFRQPHRPSPRDFRLARLPLFLLAAGSTSPAAPSRPLAFAERRGSVPGQTWAAAERARRPRRLPAIGLTAGKFVQIPWPELAPLSEML